MFKNYRLRDYDFKLIILVLALSAVGIMTIGSAEPAQQSRQMAGVAAGVVIMIALSFFNYSVILKLYWLMYIGNLVLLGLVIIMGEEGNGAQRWLKIGAPKVPCAVQACHPAGILSSSRARRSSLSGTVVSLPSLFVMTVLCFRRLLPSLASQLPSASRSR